MKTAFLNVDLDVWSRSDLTELAQAFDGLTLFCGREGRRYRASFEARSNPVEPNDAARALLRSVRKLRGRPRQLWLRATRRDFNVGVQAGHHPLMHELVLEASTVRSIAAHGARVVVTVYAPYDEERARRGAAPAARGTKKRRAR